VTQGKLVKVLGYYNDASYIERIVASLRKLLIDIDWMYCRRINDEGLYEIYLLAKDHPNLNQAILNLSKTVGVERVEVFNEFKVEFINIEQSDSGSSQHNPNNDRTIGNLFILYIPIYSRSIVYSWGKKYGQDIP